jgi:hypothetical protein
MVLHGGNDGQLSLYGRPDDRVFDFTQEELQTQIDIGDGEIMPTLEDVFTLFKGASHFLNVELKGPLSDDVKALYDYPLTC